MPEVSELRVGERFGEDVTPVLVARTPSDNDTATSYVLAHFESVAVDMGSHGAVPAGVGHYLGNGARIGSQRHGFHVRHFDLLLELLNVVDDSSYLGSYFDLRR